MSGKQSQADRRSKVLQHGAGLLEGGLRRLSIAAGTKVVAAFSGGADSLGLLALLGSLPRRSRLEVEAVHVDHGLRTESADDAARAQATAAGLGFRCTVIRLEAPVAGAKGGVEAWAREGRYAALAAAAAGRPILTAHTADDQAETVLYRLAKGSGARGLGGIRPKARLAGGLVMRPLLEVDRALLRRVVDELGLEVVEDPSNASGIFARNRLRHEVLPALEGVIPGAAGRLARAARLAREDEAYLARRAARALARLEVERGAVDAGRLLRLPAALRGRIVRALVEEAGGRIPSARRVEEVLELAEGGGELHLQGGIRAQVLQGVLRIEAGPTGRRQGIQTAPGASGRKKKG